MSGCRSRSQTSPTLAADWPKRTRRARPDFWPTGGNMKNNCQHCYSKHPVKVYYKHDKKYFLCSDCAKMFKEENPLYELLGILCRAKAFK